MVNSETRTKRSHKITLILIAGVVAIFATFLIVRKIQSRNQNTAQARQGSIVESVYGVGTVVSSKVYRLRLAIPTSVRKLWVKSGDTVAQGAPLVLTDNTLNPFKAPFHGVITSLPVYEGENVAPQATLLTLMDLSDLYVEVALEQQAAIQVKLGQKARMSFESLRGQTLDGKVKAIFPNEGQFLVHIDVNELPTGILPGMTADVSIEAARKQNVLLVPANAVTNGHVTLMREGKKIKTPVTIGLMDSESAEIIKGEVKQGDLVVLRTK